jgi:hypothetical protein
VSGHHNPRVRELARLLRAGVLHGRTRGCGFCGVAIDGFGQTLIHEPIQTSAEGMLRNGAYELLEPLELRWAQIILGGAIVNADLHVLGQDVEHGADVGDQLAAVGLGQECVPRNAFTSWSDTGGMGRSVSGFMYGPDVLRVENLPPV